MSKTDIANGVSSATEHKVQQITTRTDSREILANARGTSSGVTWMIISSWTSTPITSSSIHGRRFSTIEEIPVLRRNGKTMAEIWPNAKNLALSNHPPGLTFQDVSGRIPHQAQLAEDVENRRARDLTLVRRAMESLGIAVQIVFPQPMLEIGLHPSPDVETQLIQAYNRWFTERILAREPRIKSMSRCRSVIQTRAFARSRNLRGSRAWWASS